MPAYAASLVPEVNWLDRWRDQRMQRRLQDMGHWVSLDTVTARRKDRESRPRGPIFSPGEWVWISVTIAIIAAMGLYAFLVG